MTVARVVDFVKGSIWFIYNKRTKKNLVEIYLQSNVTILMEGVIDDRRQIY